MKILFTGATGQVGRPVAEALAAGNEVWCAARFADAEVRAALESQGIRCVAWSMEAKSLDGLPRDFTHVFHGAPYRGQPDTDTAVQANAVATGRLMEHCRAAQAFVFISTFAVYERPPAPDHPVAETDPLGGYAPYAPSYPIGKLAAEAVVRALAPILDLPSTIARLNVCYGPAGWGGLPVEMFKRVLAGEPVYLPARRQRAVVVADLDRRRHALPARPVRHRLDRAGDRQPRRRRGGDAAHLRRRSRDARRADAGLRARRPRAGRVRVRQRAAPRAARRLRERLA